MAVIGRIRKNTWLLVGFIVIAMLGFLLMDSVQSSNNLFNRNSGSTAVGTVNGSPLDYRVWDGRYQQYRKNFTNRNEGKAPENSDDYLIRDQVWNDLLKESLFGEVYDNLGITVSDKEKADMLVGKTIHPNIRQSFTNPETGRFSPEAVRNYIQNIDNDEPGQEPGEKRADWQSFIDEITRNRKENKYRTLISKSLFAPDWMARQSYEEQASTANFDFVRIPFASVPDAEMNLKDAELQAYLDANSKRFEERASRSVKAVFFPIVASAKDSANAMAYIGDKMEDFRNAESDSMFVNAYSERSFESRYYKLTEIPDVRLADTIMSMNTGDVIGPLLTGNGYEIIKLSDRKQMSDSLRVRQILFANASITSEEDRDRKVALIDSIYTALDSFGADFATLATQFSEDPVSKAKGGDLGWITPDDVDEFTALQLFHHGAPGKVIRVGNQVGLFMYEIMEEAPNEEAVKVAFLTKSIIPSSETEKQIYREASMFAGENNKQEAFESAYEAFDAVNKRAANGIGAMDYSIFGIGEARSLIKWAHEAKVGDVSSVITMDGRHCVALVDGGVDEGKPSLEQVKDKVIAEIAPEKKTELVQAIGDLNAAASKYGVEVRTASEALPFGTPEELELEPVVVTLAARMQAGQTKAITGADAIYLVQSKGGTTAAALTDYTPYTINLNGSNFTKVSNDLLPAMKETAEIEDLRGNFY